MCGNEPTRGGGSDGKDKGCDHRPKRDRRRRTGLGGMDGMGGGIYISEALIGVSPYFSRSSDVLLSVVVCWRLSLYLSIEIS